ncbi:MAG: hypothetical protein JWQ35_887 [Bacteriovoracaceae bacterium]|nr:hypothetical protein [Bacteriovoracaceae bacterium]
MRSFIFSTSFILSGFCPSWLHAGFISFDFMWFTGESRTASLVSYGPEVDELNPLTTTPPKPVDCSETLQGFVSFYKEKGVKHHFPVERRSRINAMQMIREGRSDIPDFQNVFSLLDSGDGKGALKASVEIFNEADAKLNDYEKLNLIPSEIDAFILRRLFAALFISTSHYSAVLKPREEALLEKAYSSLELSSLPPQTDTDFQFKKTVETYLQSASAKENLIDLLSFEDALFARNEILEWIKWIQKSFILDTRAIAVMLGSPTDTHLELSSQWKFWKNPQAGLTEALQHNVRRNLPQSALPLAGPIELWLRLSLFDLFKKDGGIVFVPKKQNQTYGDQLIVFPGFQLSVWRNQEQVRRVRIRFLPEDEVKRLLPMAKKFDTVNSLPIKYFVASPPPASESKPETEVTPSNGWLSGYSDFVRQKFQVSELIHAEVTESLGSDKTGKFIERLRAIKLDQPKDQELIEEGVLVISELFPEIFQDDSKWPLVLSRLNALKRQLGKSTAEQLDSFAHDFRKLPLKQKSSVQISAVDLNTFVSGELPFEQMSSLKPYAFKFQKQEIFGNQNCFISNRMIDFFNERPLLGRRMLAAFQKGFVTEYGSSGFKKLTNSINGFVYEIKLLARGAHLRIGVVRLDEHTWFLENLFDDV